MVIVSSSLYIIYKNVVGIVLLQLNKKDVTSYCVRTIFLKNRRFDFKGLLKEFSKYSMESIWHEQYRINSLKHTFFCPDDSLALFGRGMEIY
jgi:hypothetical protein